MIPVPSERTVYRSRRALVATGSGVVVTNVLREKTMLPPPGDQLGFSSRPLGLVVNRRGGVPSASMTKDAGAAVADGPDEGYPFPVRRPLRLHTGTEELDTRAVRLHHGNHGREVGWGLRGEDDAVAVQDGRDGGVVNEKHLPHHRHPDGGENEHCNNCSDAVVPLT